MDEMAWVGFGYGLSENIADAYRFLMQTYQPGDRVFVFGFSRGAYTARALCGLLEMCGLLRRGSEGLIPYALRLFKRQQGRFDSVRGVPNKFYAKRLQVYVQCGLQAAFRRPLGHGEFRGMVPGPEWFEKGLNAVHVETRPDRCVTSCRVAG